MRETIRTTFLGGVVFVVPLVCVFVLVGKAFEIMKLVGTPLSKVIPVSDVAGIPVAELMTGFLLFVCCLAAGLAAKSPVGRKLHRKLDSVLLELVPGYAWIKGMTGDISDQDARKLFQPVLVRFDDQYQIGYLADKAASRFATIYFPGAPNARSGTISIVETDRLKLLDLDFGTINKLCKKLGRGSGALFDEHTFHPAS